MDDQTKPSNFFANEDNSGQSRPLTSFLQAQQTVRTGVPPQDDGENSAPRDDGFMDGLFGKTGDNAGGNGFPPNENVMIEPTVSSKDSISKDFDSNKLIVALKALRQVEQQIATVISLLGNGSVVSASETLQSIGSAVPTSNEGQSSATHEDLAILKPIDGRVVEGVFDGRGMVGSDGKSYLVPPNYASKSKLVEGDMLKLTITPKGSFIYKQIGPIERSRLIGSLGYDQTIGEFYATSDNRRWNVLKASVTYFKGEPGDEVVLLVPKNAPSRWAAVENVIKRNPLG